MLILSPMAIAADIPPPGVQLAGVGVVSAAPDQFSLDAWDRLPRRPAPLSPC
jgi:hypothetical protein